MSILSKIKSWSKEKGEFYTECLYPENNLPLYWLVNKVLSKVNLADEFVTELKNLSSKGVVIYALKQKSQLNSLIIRELSAKKGIPQPVYSHGVNMIVWQPFAVGVKAILKATYRFLFKNNRPQSLKKTYLNRITVNAKSSIIHLGGTEYVENQSVEDAITQLIEAQRKMDVPIFIVPELITYGRRREREKETLINILFGQEENTGPLRRVTTFLRYSNKILVISAEPINLAEFIEANKNLPIAELCHQLRAELIYRIDEEKAAMVGPTLKSQEEIINMTLQDSELINFMETLAQQGKPKHNAITKDASRYLREIASDYDEMFVEIWDKLLSWLWNNIYDGVVVDREGISKLRTLSKKTPYIIIPCHRSHIDYLLLSYVFYKNNLQMPFIAAGSNLSFWPVGYIFRKSGAFFIRRSFRGNVLYGTVLSKYIETMMKEGLPLEFFIEGGRSRTGKMMMPKYGLLSMIIQAFKKGAFDDLALVPVYIGYDRVMEEKAYLKELTGAPKEQEKTSDVIKSSKLLRKRYGRVYVNIGEPILLKDYIASQEKLFEEMTVVERQSFYRKIGYEIVREINNVSVVTPFSLVSTGLLCHDKRGIAHDELMDVLDEFYNYLVHIKASLAATLANRHKATEDALNLFDQLELIVRMGAEEDEEDVEEIVYSLEDKKRLNLEYYKNNILHFFLPISFVATSVLSCNEDTVPLNKILEDYRFFKRLFRHEFIFDDRKNDLDEVNEVLLYLKSRRMITTQEHEGSISIDIKSKGRISLMPFAGLIHNYIESYWVAIRGCFYLKKEARMEKEFTKKVLRLGEKMYKKGEIRRAEALSQSTYRNAIRYLQDLKIILTIEDEKKDTKKLSLAPIRGPIETLRHRLFKFL
jgi:glycerol-3-phosphate O-acyltransferase